MEFNRFKEIIKRNRDFEEHIDIVLEEFHQIINWTGGDIPKMIKEIGDKLDTLIVQIPMKDPEFGACYFATSYSKYLLLNSNQARNKMYFSFCHDIYHILNGTPDYINEKREVHLNQSYFENDNESKASFFAANLLMPKNQFKQLYGLYSFENNSIEEIAAKLMTFFEAPYVSVLIRMYELDLLKDLSGIVELLKYDNITIEKTMEELWLDKDCLLASRKDEAKYLFKSLENEGSRLVEKGLLSDYDFQRMMKNIKSLYLSIRVCEND